MSRPLLPLPDHDPLTVTEVAAALGVDTRTIARHARNGWLPGAFQTPGSGPGPGRWRIPHDTALKVGRELGVLDDPR